MRIGPRTHHVEGGLGCPAVKKAPQGFAVNRHALPRTALAERLRPGETTLRACVRIKTGEHAAERIVRRNAMGHSQNLLEPLGLRLAIFFDIFSAFSPAEHRAYRNDQNIQQAMPGVGTSGIDQSGKVLADGDGRDALHGPVSSPGVVGY